MRTGATYIPPSKTVCSGFFLRLSGGLFSILFQTLEVPLRYASAPPPDRLVLLLSRMSQYLSVWTPSGCTEGSDPAFNGFRLYALHQAQPLYPCRHTGAGHSCRRFFARLHDRRVDAAWKVRPSGPMAGWYDLRHMPPARSGCPKPGK